uniref:All-trans retinoic acid induced differentiation factor n=1 Tax=Sphenodon punctatus TaxID=8508 RepID=A0A8D0HC53_SPHPU
RLGCGGLPGLVLTSYISSPSRLDLGNCSLQQIVPGFQEASTAVIIDLTGNPLQSLPDGAFRGFTHLQTLALPPSLDCPGGSAVWDSVSTVGGSRTCRGQRSPCNGTAQPGTPGGGGTGTACWKRGPSWGRG